MTIPVLKFVCLISLAVCVSAQSLEYGAVIDAGSSGSRINLFSWPSRYSAGTVPPPLSVLQVGAFSDDTPGLSSYASHPEDAGKSLASLLDYVRQKAGQLGVSIDSIPIYLKATAGLRILAPSVVTAILTNVRAFLSNSGFSFRNSNARVISGEEEGTFGWVAVNYLQNTLSADPSTTIGALDMGGASTQITFAPQDEVLSSYFPLHLNGNYYPLYTHSYLYYGLNEMTDRVDDIVSRSTPVGSFTPHPCLNAGFFRNFTTSTGQLIQFYGTSDFANCSAILMPLLHTNSAEFPCYYPSQCSIEGNYQPRLGSATFIAFSNFASVFRRTLLLPQTASIGLIRSTMNTVCNSNMTALHQMYPNAGKYLPAQCLVGTYFLNLLSAAYHFSDNSVSISFVGSSPSGVDYGWALGAMLYEENLLPWRLTAQSDWTPSLIGVTGALLFVLLALIVTVVHYQNRLSKFETNQHVPLLNNNQA